MDDDPDQLDRHVEDLLHDRRPERTPLPDEDALRARQTAAMLRAAKPGAGLPSSDFLNRMQASIDGWVAERAASMPRASGYSRRTIIASALGGIAAGVLAVLGIERLSRGGTAAPPSASVLVPNGNWKTLMSLDTIPESTPVRFSGGAIEGFLIRQGQDVRALSAVCTHMGCLLNWSKFRTRFECPCHGATFDRAGQASGRYEMASLPPLPSIKVRVQQGQVQVYIV